MKLKEKIQKAADRAALRAIDLLVPEREEDSFIDLKIEQLEGRQHCDRPILPEEPQKPVYRRDGQVHNFAAAAHPGQRRITRAQYGARYGNDKPEPTHSVAGLNDIQDDAFEAEIDAETQGIVNEANRRR